MGRSPPPFFPGAGRTPAREMRRFARPGRGRHDLGGLCGHGAGTSRGRESSGEDLTARSTALTRPAWSANSADAKTASAQFCWRCGELIRQGLPLTEADGKTERTPHLAEAHPLRLIGVLQMDQRAKDEAKTKAKGWKRKSPSTWSVALAAPASLAAAADSGGQCLRRAPLPNDEGQETAITVPPDTRYLGDVPWQAVEAEQKARARSAGCVLTLQLAKPSHDAVQS
ncbi:unnamed protein product [Effrenium voratum]|nr:unnamed protein product [Effrenium voratum]